MRTRPQVAVGALLWLLRGPLAAHAAPLRVGDRAPDFALPDQNGRVVKLSDFYGKKGGAIRHIDEGSAALDPSRAHQACELQRK